MRSFFLEEITRQVHFFLFIINSITEAMTAITTITANIIRAWSMPPEVVAMGVTLTSSESSHSTAAFTALTL